MTRALLRSAEFTRAARLYKRFSGHDAAPLATVPKPRVPPVAIAVGTVDFIGYTTVRNGKLESYVHKFHVPDRALFVVAPDGKQLFLVGGRFRFTARGIVDRSDRAD